MVSPRRVRVPSAHGEALGPRTGLRGLGYPGKVVRVLGGNANMHWLVEGSQGRAVLRRYGPWRTEAEVAYELRVLERVAGLGWVVPRALGEPARVGRHLGCLFSHLPGAPRRVQAEASVRAEQRSRGRLLAQLHADLATLSDMGQRPGWVLRDEVLGDRSDRPTVEEVIRARVQAEDAAVLLEYAERARQRFEALQGERSPVLVNHGDLIAGNVLYRHGQLSGIIDFDFAHLDYRAADFVWTWRGQNDEFVRGYEEVSPLSDAERAMLAPAFWVSVLDSTARELRWWDGREAPEGPDGRERVARPGTVAYLRRQSAFTEG